MKGLLQGLKKAYEGTMSALKRVFRWCKRTVFGGKRELSEIETEKIQSPAKLLWSTFFRRKGAVVALGLLLALFAFVWIAPAFVPLRLNATDPLQQNVAPGYSLRKVPKGLRGQIADINGFADFTVGLSKAGGVYVWGNTKDRLSGKDVKKIPQSVKAGAAFLAAGKDHILCVTKAGEIVGWGDDSCGQYGTQEKLNALAMPAFLAEGVDPDRVASLSCGYQTSALVCKDGRAYVWGNVNAAQNLPALQGLTDVEKIVFCNSVAIALKKDGSIYTGGEHFRTAVRSRGGVVASLADYLQGERAVKIAADNKCIALVTQSGELLVSGAFENGEDELPTLKAGELFTDVVGGRRHFIAVTNLGRAYVWGDTAYGQGDLPNATDGGKVFAGALQSYLVSGTGKLKAAAGLKGYLMGTDGRGRDVFARIVHGGKTTMSVGLVAVVVSSLLAVVVGCLAGYFGGWVDTLLMRITEIFSAIPFLPFAMLLSQIIKNYNLSESMRIFIIMLILGALSWTGLARMLRGQILSEREKEFVTAAKALGVKERTIAFKHVLPNVLSVILVSVTLDFAGCLLTESSLSYLGFGVQQPRPTWGNMLSGSNNSTVIQKYWWQWLFPALFLSLAVICINLVGDALRDALDPKNKEE